MLTGHPVTDTSFGFRAMRAEVTAAVTLTQPQYQSSELLIGAISRGLRVVERPMSMRKRGAGKSKKGNNLVYGLRYARVVLGTWARERPARAARSQWGAATDNGVASGSGVVTDTVVTDTVVRDTVVTDTVVTDGVVTDGMVTESAAGRTPAGPATRT